MMQKLKKQLQSIQPVYFIGGGIISLLLVFLILTPALEIGSDKIKGNSFPYLFAMITGSILLFLLLMRHFLSRKFRTLRNYYLMAAVISFTVTLMLLVLFVSFIHSEITLTSYGEMDEETVGNILSLVMFGCCTAVFLLCFHLLTKNKSQYVSYICENVSKIAETDKPVEIRERGGDELEQISASINRMAKELAEKRSREQALERQRSELITNVSHDLRSPLTSIIGYVRLLKENGCRDEAKFNEYIEVTDRRLDGLNKLVNELFELTKLDAPDFTVDLEKGDVTAIVRQFGFEMGLILEQHALTLTCDIDDTPFETMLDYERFARVMQNLFANVIKYAEPGTTVALKSRTAPDSITVSLTNRIAGGTSVDTKNMFDRFYKEDAARTDTSGAGLGLAIAKRIVELHGGEIYAESGSGNITVTLKLYRSSQTADN
ncbi:MAG: HAMP domain-containing histidine kinase [Oscillospiraceae bacterium]|nr:HAMP domain-containing histidine kinase [Oscillospiraceae bacterium]